MKHLEFAAQYARANGFELSLIPEGLQITLGVRRYIITYIELEHAVPNIPILIMKCMMSEKR